MEVNKKSNTSLKLTFAFLTALLILFQFYFLSYKLPLDMAYTNKTVGFFSIYLEKLQSSFTLWPALIAFLLAHILIQSLLASFIYLLAKELCQASTLLSKNFFVMALVLWLVFQMNIFLWNWYIFPYSFFSINLTKLTNHSIVYFFLLILSSLCLAFSFIAAVTIKIKKRRLNGILLIIIGLILLFAIPYLVNKINSRTFFKPHKSPNIIVIITDSLRPDYADNANTKTNEPAHVQGFIKKSAFFANSLTLLGRSTPGLISILTGNYPKTSGARFNLTSTQNLHLENSLTHILKSKGYQNIFVADGRQFINLDKNFGFDQIISAKYGIYDFIFSIVNDTPLSNLLMNSYIGEALFPYNYANRNSYYTYLPNSFIDLIDHKLINRDPNKPVLFVAALTVAHWPYVWARQPQYDNLSERYEDSVVQLNKQFGALLSILKNKGLLENSIVITLSDHGDSLGLPGDRIIAEENYIGAKDRLSLISRFPYMVKADKNNNLIGINTSAGHGTDLLSMTQLQTTLAFHFNAQIQSQKILKRVSLIDVTPTLLDMLNMHLPIKFEGISLKPILFENTDIKKLNRPLFLETEIDIPLIDVTKNSTQSAVSRLINQYSHLYDIDLTTQQLVLKNSVIPTLLPEKQKGIIYGEWMLVYFPGKNRLQTDIISANSSELKNCYYAFPANKNYSQKSQYFCYHLSPTSPYFVLINLNNLKWEIFLPQDSVSNPVFQSLFTKLKEFYGTELPPLPQSGRGLEKSHANSALTPTLSHSVGEGVTRE